MINDIIKDIINNDKYNLQDKFFYKFIKNHWNDIIGSEFSDKTYPDRLFGKTLYIACSNQGLINILHFYKRDIINNVNKLLENDINIVDVKFFFRSFI